MTVGQKIRMMKKLKSYNFLTAFQDTAASRQFEAEEGENEEEQEYEDEDEETDDDEDEEDAQKKASTKAGALALVLSQLVFNQCLPEDLSKFLKIEDCPSNIKSQLEALAKKLVLQIGAHHKKKTDKDKYAILAADNKKRTTMEGLLLQTKIISAWKDRTVSAEQRCPDELLDRKPSAALLESMLWDGISSRKRIQGKEKDGDNAEASEQV